MSEDLTEGAEKQVQNIPAKSQKSKKAKFVENFGSLFLAILLVLSFRSTVFEAFKIPSGSMIPTLFVGDHIIVNKFSYGLILPFSDFLGNPIYLARWSEPARGDIIVFRYPKDESTYYIKRIVAGPGDRIEMQNKRLLVNGAPVSRKALDINESNGVVEDLADTYYTPEDVRLFLESPVQDKDYWIMIDQRSDYNDAFEAITVPDDSYFVMGDNRDHSNDSRAWGFVPSKNIRGKASFIWLSLWVDLEDRSYTFRSDRMGIFLN